MENKLKHEDEINSFMLSVLETDEYKNVEYLIFTIRRLYLDFLSNARLTGYILDLFGETKIDIQTIAKGEVLLHKVNQYGLSVVNGVEFFRDYFVFENKAYLYSILTKTKPIQLGDKMPAFARIIVDDVHDGNILLRLDERLSLPLEQAISYSSLDFEKYYGPQFHFRDSVLERPKTITVHIDGETNDKLLMVVKKDYDTLKKQPFWHVEIETLPNISNDTLCAHCITTFLHGMYYPESDTFAHIDCTRNQYAINDYLKKYSESSENFPVDLYTKDGLHYKIWCIENGQYSREIWYNLMMASLPNLYQKLLDEILE